MKVAHLLYAEGIAGAEKYLMDLLPMIRKYGIDAELICIAPPFAAKQMRLYCDELIAQGVPAEMYVGTRSSFFSVASKVNKFLRKKNLTVVHSHLINSDILAVMIKKLFYKKLFIISSKHGYDENYLVKYSANTEIKIDKNLYYYVTRFLLSNININLAVSYAIAQLYLNIKLSKSLYKVVHHGVGVVTPENMIGDTRFRIAQQQLIIVGRLEKMKGHKYLIDALPHVQKAFPDFKLLILGQGSERAAVDAQAKQLGVEKNIHFMGFQDDPYSFISNSDVIILPSLFEPFGLVYIESFALKTPVVAFDVQATNEIVTNNETGFLVPKGDSEKLAERIIYLLSDEGERKRISTNAYSRYKDHFTIERMASETGAWYREVLKDL